MGGDDNHGNGTGDLQESDALLLSAHARELELRATQESVRIQNHALAEIHRHAEDLQLKLSAISIGIEAMSQQCVIVTVGFLLPYFFSYSRGLLLTSIFLRYRIRGMTIRTGACIFCFRHNSNEDKRTKQRRRRRKRNRLLSCSSRRGCYIFVFVYRSYKSKNLTTMRNTKTKKISCRFCGEHTLQQIYTI